MMMIMNLQVISILLLLLLTTVTMIQGFAFSHPAAAAICSARIQSTLPILSAEITSEGSSSVSSDAAGSEQEDPNEIVARRILMEGDVNGGYYRACVLNEAGKFRGLFGTMSPPDSGSREAEIYVEGKRKLVEGFLRWCKRGDVGLSQKASVVEVIEEEPTGLYDAFYCQTK